MATYAGKNPIIARRCEEGQKYAVVPSNAQYPYLAKSIMYKSCDDEIIYTDECWVREGKDNMETPAGEKVNVIWVSPRH